MLRRRIVAGTMKYDADMNRIKVRALAKLDCHPEYVLEKIIEKGVTVLDEYEVAAVATVLYLETRSTDRYKVFTPSEHRILKRALNKWFDIKLGTVAKAYNAHGAKIDEEKWSVFSKVWTGNTDRRIAALKKAFEKEFWAARVKCNPELLNVFMGEEVDKYKLLENIKKFESERYAFYKKDVMRVVNE